MNTELQIFDNSEFGSIRTIEVNGKPYFAEAMLLQHLDMQNQIMR